MNRHSKVVLAIVLLGLLAIGGWKWFQPVLLEKTKNSISEKAEKGTITLAMDSWVGYFPICSRQMKRRLLQQGYALLCTDDNADYQQRFKKLKNDDYHFAVATVDSYLLNAERFDYPGAIIGVIDQSKGGDAIVARKAKLDNLDQIKQLADPSIALTKNSPSHHLLKSISEHFDLNSYKDAKNIISSDGSADALDKLNSKQVDIAVLWEPELSKALSDDQYVKLIGTEDTHLLIVDILLASAKTLSENPQLINDFLSAYFSTLKFYRDNPEELINDVSKKNEISKPITASLLNGVNWASLYDNAQYWFNVSGENFNEVIIDSVDANIKILIQSNDFKANPIPNEDSYRLINRSFISELYQQFVKQGLSSDKQQTISFESLSDAQWDNLTEIGSLKARKITFSSGTDNITDEGKALIDELIEDLIHYPNFRIEIRGHTGVRGDLLANQQLSQYRAQAVLDYINWAHEIGDNRLRAIGFGASRPLKKIQGESNRNYNYRLPRVEIVLVREVL